MNQGEPGTAFYIIKEGQAVAMKYGTEVMSTAPVITSELALIRDQPRAATVAFKGPRKVMLLDSRSLSCSFTCRTCSGALNHVLTVMTVAQHHVEIFQVQFADKGSPGSSGGAARCRCPGHT